MGMTQAQADELCRRAGAPRAGCPVKEKASKLKNVKKELDGIRFDSSLECETYRILKLWERAGAISDLRMQLAFTLQERFRDSQGRTVRAITYSLDFRFFDEKQRKLRYVDSKGFVTQGFLRTMKLMKGSYPDVEVELWNKATIKELSRC